MKHAREPGQSTESAATPVAPAGGGGQLQLKQSLRGMNYQQGRAAVAPGGQVQKKDGGGATVPDLDQSEALGGHCLKHHGPDLSMDDMKQRVMGTHSSLPQSRTALKFTSQASLDDALQALFNRRGKQIGEHFSGGGGDLDFRDEATSAGVGEGYTNTATRSKPEAEEVKNTDVKKAAIFLKPNAAANQGFYVHTFFPKWP